MKGAAADTEREQRVPRLRHTPPLIRDHVSVATTPQALRKFHHWPLAVLLVCALAIRVALIPLYARLPGGFYDEDFWKLWMQAIHDHGVLNVFRATDSEYLGYQWLLWLLASIYQFIGGSYTQTSPSLHALVKVPSIAFDLMLIVVVYEATRLLYSESTAGSQHDGRRREWAALTAAALFAFQPAVLYDSAIWAQTDAGVTAAMLGSLVLAASRRPWLGWLVWTLGFLIKPHPVIMLPILVVVTVRAHGWCGAARASTAVPLVVAIVLGPWIAHGDLGRILDTYHRLFTADYERLSSSAWNLWWFVDVASHPHPEDDVGGAWLTYRMLGLALSAMAGGLAVLAAARLSLLRGALLGAAYASCAFYVLPISTHERYLYPFLALMLPVVVVERRWLWLYIPLSATLVLNLIVVAPPISAWTDRWIESPFSLAVAACNVTLFCVFTMALALELWHAGIAHGDDGVSEDIGALRAAARATP